MLVQSCLLRRSGPCYQHLTCTTPPPQWTQQIPYQRLARRDFRATSRRDEMQNHYATLDLPTNATQGEIKKKFYTLSKTYHPDLHPDNPDASKRFVAISEAYSTLGSKTAREKYDRDFLRQAPSGSAGGSGGGRYPSGSYSSSSSPGGRPASGLSKRRTQFRGPPPSFYRSGGWGEQGEKRSEASSRPSHAHESANQNTGASGTGPGGFTAGFDNDVPHFDQRGHYEMHEKVARGRHKTRRRAEKVMDDYEASGGAMGGSWGAFVVISGVLGIALGAPALFSGAGKDKEKEKKKDS